MISFLPESRCTGPEFADQWMEYFEHLKLSGADDESLREFGSLLCYLERKMHEISMRAKENASDFFECLEMFKKFKPRNDATPVIEINKSIFKKYPHSWMHHWEEHCHGCAEWHDSLNNVVEKFKEWEKSSSGGEH